MITLSHKSLFAIALLCIALMLLPNNTHDLIFLRIENIKQGEYWRFFSGHFIHYSWFHCASNVIGLLLLAGIFNNTKHNINWLLASIFICIVISSGLMLFSNQLSWYVGFSGVLTGLYAYASIKTYSENRKLSVMILIVLSSYVVFQLLEGELISSVLLQEIKTSSYAHAYGLFAGILYGVITKLK